MLQIPSPSYHAFAFWVFTIICAGVGSYLGAYLKKKGENVATREDLNALVEQVKLTTEATKAVEERIAHQFSHKTRLWEMKKEALYETLTILTDLDEAILDEASVHQMTAVPTYDPAQLLQDKIDALDAWHKAYKAYSVAYAKSLVVCGGTTTDAIRKAFHSLVDVYSKVRVGDLDAYTSNPTLQKDNALVLKRVREELDVHEHGVYSNTP